MHMTVCTTCRSYSTDVVSNLHYREYTRELIIGFVIVLSAQYLYMYLMRELHLKM